MILKRSFICLVLGLLGCGLTQISLAQTTFKHDHGDWTQLLQRHVRLIADGNGSQVDYRAFAGDRDKLADYLGQLASVSSSEFQQWSREERLAFLINAYNAWTVELILTEYPDISSIRDLGSLFRSPWSRRFVPLFGEMVSLDHIEHELIRGPDGFEEPRIHFAVNCASVGCPALREEAYLGDRLESQLEDATSRFLADRSRNRLDGNVLRVSELFDWYEEDFEQGWRGTRSVAQFLSLYSGPLELPDSVTLALQRDRFRIRYLDYDWSLNNVVP